MSLSVHPYLIFILMFRKTIMTLLGTLLLRPKWRNLKYGRIIIKRD